jgi:hypothetical protein
MAASDTLIGRDTDRGLGDYVRETARKLDSLVRGAYHGALRNTQIYLIMSHDDSKGRIKLQGDRARVLWHDVGRQNIFRKANDALYLATKALGGSSVYRSDAGVVFREAAGRYFADPLIQNGKLAPERALDAFLRFEQMGSYARYLGHDVDDDIRGIARVKKFAEETRRQPLIYADSRGMTLSDQKVYRTLGSRRSLPRR